MGPGISPGNTVSSFPRAHPTHVLLLTGTCTHALTLWAKNFVFLQMTGPRVPIWGTTFCIKL